VCLLYEENVSSASSKKTVAYVVGHELAHQWFGNLITFDWWDDLWLNEGFATWAGWLATDHLFPDWKVWMDFVNDDLQRGLGLDALKSSHPIQVPVNKPSEIHQIFDAISYSKGASVIRMLANYLGSNTFQKGVCSYLENFKYKNAVTLDLWKALEDASGKPVRELMRLWTEQTGYPVIHVTESVDSENVSVKFYQERFLASGKVQKEDDNALWFVPLQIISSQDLLHPSDIVLKTKESTHIIMKTSQFNDSGSFYKLNAGHTGFYRTNYSDNIWERLGRAAQQGKLVSSDKIGMAADVFALARAGHTSMVNGLTILSMLKDEEDYVVRSDMASQLSSLKFRFWDQPEVISNIKTFSSNLFYGLCVKLGWEFDEKENYLTTLLRTLAIGMTGKANHPEIVKEAKRRFELFKNGDQTAINPNLKGSVFSIVLGSEGGEAEFDFVLNLYKTTTIPDQKLIALSSLASVENEALLNRLLEFGLSENVRPQDINNVIYPVAANPKGRKLCWEFVKKNWTIFHERYYSGSMAILSRIVASATEGFASQAYYNEVENFFKDKPVENINRSIQQSLEKIMASKLFLERDGEKIAKWLSLNKNI
jgi:aminopeptidase 2